MNASVIQCSLTNFICQLLIFGIFANLDQAEWSSSVMYQDRPLLTIGEVRHVPPFHSILLTGYSPLHQTSHIWLVQKWL